MTTKLDVSFSGSHSSVVATVGGGVTTDQILQILRILYMGGVKCDSKVAQHIVSGEGPTRFLQCHRFRIKPEAAATTLGRNVLECLREGRDEITYEAGLRWFLNSPGEHMHHGEQSRRIAILPPEPLFVDDKAQVILFYPGGDGPCVYLVGVDLEKPWPDWDFVMARAIASSPYCL